MGMYELYVGKKVKIVWEDDSREKAVVGVLEGFDGQFVTIRADRDNNLMSLSIKAIVSISEWGVKE